MKVKNLYRDVTKRGPIRSVSLHKGPFSILRCHSRSSVVPILAYELSRLREGAILVLHDEATLLPVAQQDGKFRLRAVNLTHTLNLYLIKRIVNKEQKIAHTRSMINHLAVGIYRLLHLIAEETHLAPQIILHAPLYEILNRLLPFFAVSQIKHHRTAETIRQTTLGKLSVIR